MKSRSFREYRVILAFIAFAISTVYYRYAAIDEHETVLNDVATIANGHPEKSSLIYLNTRNAHVNLRIKIDGISREQTDYKSKRSKYIQLTKAYVCSSKELLFHLNQNKPIIVDLTSTDFPSGQFANIRITTESCV